MKRRECIATLVAGAALAASSGSAWAQAAPLDKTLRIVVGFPAGGAGDSIARMLAVGLATQITGFLLLSALSPG
ncbi:MAG: tripartite tricarboxylate transporter substrate binding protein, partial [Gammaproteobacteria bacterium]|nr:tripartite tricarboxylate transporter substrate binding protein [Gammaproteobacteria bacterium]